MTPSQQDREILGVHHWRISKRLVTTRYTAAGRVGKRSADELLITTLPPAIVPVDEQLRLPQQAIKAAKNVLRMAGSTGPLDVSPQTSSANRIREGNASGAS
jgi:hypothetical protein